jgi:hypothetical protein
VPVIAQDIAATRRYIEDLLDRLDTGGEEAFELAVAEDRPGSWPRALESGERFLAARAWLTVLPDDIRPEQVWVRWDTLPTDEALQKDVLSLAGHYRDIIRGRAIGRPKK